MNSNRFFKALSLTSFGLAAYNTLNNTNIRRIKDDLEIERLKNLELQDKYDKLANKKIEELESVNESNKSLVENIQNIINSKDGSSGSNSLIETNFIDSINQFLSTLNFEQTLAILHISGSIFIILSIYSILLIFLGDSLINYFNLEEKYPKIANFIKIRRKFQKYYITLNVIIILLVLLTIIYINLTILFTPCCLINN